MAITRSMRAAAVKAVAAKSSAKKAAVAKKPAKTAAVAKAPAKTMAMTKTPAKIAAVANADGKKAGIAKAHAKTIAVMRTPAKKAATAITVGTIHHTARAEEIRQPRRDYFPFMELPGEIRNMIYRTILVQPGIVFISGDEYGPGYREDVVSRHLPVRMRGAPDRIMNHSHLFINLPTVRTLLGTSKQIYDEAAWFYYGCNHFHFSNLPILYNFLQATRPDFRRHITRMSLQYSGQFVVKAVKLLPGCVSLSRLRLVLNEHTMGHRLMKTSARLRDMTGLKDLLQLRGLRVVVVDTHLIDSVGNYATSLADKDYVVNALQVLKEPHNPAKLKRQFEKDYPDQVPQRRVSVKTKVAKSTKRKTGAKSTKSRKS